jgi:hypothetical protein
MGPKFNFEYIDLCMTESRDGGVYDLIAHHVFQPGDWWMGDSDGPPIFCWDGGEDWAPTEHDGTWLPVEGDWLDLLEAEGCCVNLSRAVFADRKWYVATGWEFATGNGFGEKNLKGGTYSGETASLAMANLYMAVKGIEL